MYRLRDKSVHCSVMYALVERQVSIMQCDVRTGWVPWLIAVRFMDMSTPSTRPETKTDYLWSCFAQITWDLVLQRLPEILVWIDYCDLVLYRLPENLFCTDYMWSCFEQTTCDLGLNRLLWSCFIQTTWDLVLHRLPVILFWTDCLWSCSEQTTCDLVLNRLPMILFWTDYLQSCFEQTTCDLVLHGLPVILFCYKSWFEIKACSGLFLNRLVCILYSLFRGKYESSTEVDE